MSKDDDFADDELRPEYSESMLKQGVRGKYAERYAAGTNLVRLEPDVAQAFPSSAAVNHAFAATDAGCRNFGGDAPIALGVMGQSGRLGIRSAGNIGDYRPEMIR